MDEAKHDIQRRGNLYLELVAQSQPNPMPASPPGSGATSANEAELTDRLRERKPGNLPVPETKSAMFTAQDEERIRRAVRHAVRFTRKQDTDQHIEYLFDLVPYLNDAARAIARHETTVALSEIMGAD